MYDERSVALTVLIRRPRRLEVSYQIPQDRLRRHRIHGVAHQLVPGIHGGLGDTEQEVSEYISSALIADIFDVTTARVAADVMRVRTYELGSS